MSFKRFDPEDIVLSSELITFPTWYTQVAGDTSQLDMVQAVECDEQGFSTDYYRDYYSVYVAPGSSQSGIFDEVYSKALFSLAYASRPSGGMSDFSPSYSYEQYTKKDDQGHYVEESGVKYYVEIVDPETGEKTYEQASSPLSDDGTYFVEVVKYPPIIPSEVVYGQYRSLVLGDEDSDFRFGNTRVDADNTEAYADSFIALSVDRARFREKLDPNTCRIHLTAKEENSEDDIILAPDISANRRYLDAGRVFDLARYTKTGEYKYPEKGSNGAATSYGYFLPDIGVILFNTSNSASLFANGDTITPETWEKTEDKDKITKFKAAALNSIILRSQETVTSNFVFVRARNAEFNYSTNPSNITGSAGNIRHDVMINQPQSFITTVGLYNDANELLAVAKLSRPLIKDFTKEALIRVKLDY